MKINSHVLIIIPCRNKELVRIKKCISFAKKAIKNYSDLIEIVVVDYSSKKPIKLKGTNILTIKGQPEWNKCHLINTTITKTKSEYIMILDVDMILTKEHIDEIMINLFPNNFIVDTHVKRIDYKDISNNMNKMIKKSVPWYNKDRTEYFNQANGGIQVYSRDFWKKIKGLPESLGKYWGAEDNWIYFAARINGLTIVDIAYPLIHMSHSKPEQKNISSEEKKQIVEWVNYKSRWLDFVCKIDLDYNPESHIAEEKPCMELYNDFLDKYSKRQKVLEEAIKKGKYEIEYLLEKYNLEKEKPSILIIVPNNYGFIPDYFVWDLFSLYNYTRSFYPCISIQQVSACDISLMRNLGIEFAKGKNSDGKKFTYLVQLDTDHHYPQDFLVKFLDKMEKDNLDILTGLTPTKKQEHYSSQYYKIITPISTKENCVPYNKPINKIIQIEASGPVGMVMNTKIFDKLPFPWYFQRYELPTKEFPDYRAVGGDIWFCEQCKRLGIKIYCDLSTFFPHHDNNQFLYRGAQK